jgi:selenocysteine-specific elongation factor
VLGAESIRPGEQALVRIHLPVDLPLLPGDRFVLRERGRDETVGGGEVLDVDPVLPASRALPDRSVSRVVAERGWVTAEQLARLTGEERSPDVGHWVVAPDVLAADRQRLLDDIEAAGEHGVDLASLDERRRALTTSMVSDPMLTAGGPIRVEAGRVYSAAAADPLADHPAVHALAVGGCAPDDPVGLDRGQLRELARRGIVWERDGIWFHASAVDAAAAAAARLLTTQPDGFTMAQLRDALGVTRKFAVPLATELDARGITRRRGDLRIGGPRLPNAD